MSNIFVDKIFIQIHIPRTAGTAFQNHIGSAYDKTDDRWLRHYHWTEGFSPFNYNFNDIPLLRHRTKDQQKHLKFITGHSTFSNAHRWLKISRDPLYITFVRDPLKRILSSFNHRHSRHMLTQDPASFSASPLMNTNAVSNGATASDYDTLWEFYKDAYIEHNLQSKWIIKSFLRQTHDANSWQYHPTYDGDLSYVMTMPVNNVPVTMPEWFWWQNNNNYWDIVQPLLNKFWWISAKENLTSDIKDLCEIAEVPFVENVYENKSGEKVKPYWTIDDVIKQHDVQKIIDSEIHDYALYNFVNKLCPRPF